MLRSENRREEIAALWLVLAGVLLRVLPHPDNFTPLAAIALFGGVTLRPRLSLTVPLAAMIASDLIIGPHSLFAVTWGCFFLTSLAGVWVRRDPKPSKIAALALGNSVFYFVVTNFAVFLFENMYPKTWAGLQECFIMALPFFRNSVLGDLFFSALFLVSFALLKRRLNAVAA